MRLIFDAHLDLAWNAVSYNRDQKEPVATINMRERGMVDSRARGGACVSLPEMRLGGVAVCLATVLCRAKRVVQPPEGHLRISPDYGTQDIAYAMGQGQRAYYRLLEQQGHMRQIRSVGELDDHWRQWEKRTLRVQGSEFRVQEQNSSEIDDWSLDIGDSPIGFILAMEGADPIVEPAQAEAWWQDGLRSLILAHYGQGHYSDGTGGTGGLTPKGRDLLKEMQRLGMVLDVTHTTDRSFFEATDLFAGPLMASHSNCRALVPDQRQLTDEQIKLLLDREAVIGVSLDAWMLQPGWVIGQTQPAGLRLPAVVDQIDRYCQLAGNADHVAIGSDLDGGFGAEQRPEDVHSIADLQNLVPLLSDRGYSGDDINKIMHANWLRFFRRHLPAE